MLPGRLRNERLQPSAGPAHRVGWVILGRWFLTGLIGRQIDISMPLVDVSPDERGQIRWRATSVLAVMYLELLDYVRRHEESGIGTCGRCGGPILRTRKSGPSGNRWHRGCRAGRVERWRAARERL